MTSKNDKYDSWIKRFICLAATTAFLCVPAYAQDDDDLEEIEGFTVTGSRIARLDLETPNPVIRFTREDLLNTGFTNLGDSLRSLPFNTSFANVVEGSNISFAAGTETVNLRGLGNNNTLVLINGRRAVPSGAGAVNGFLSVIDINSIPSSAIESMDILKDGASAIYGSDAVAGVLNVNLRRDYVGAAIDISYGNTLSTDSAEKSIFALYGTATEKTSIVASFDWYERNGIKNSDFEFSANADMRADKNDPSFFTYGDDGRLNGIDWRSSRAVPARFYTPSGVVRTFLNRTTNPRVENIVPVSPITGAGFYNYQEASWLRPEITRVGFNFFAQHDITEDLYIFTETSYRQIEFFQTAAAAPFTSTDKGAGTNNRLLIPKESPYNPYGERYFPGAGQDIELQSFRMINGGPRTTDATSIYPRIVAGVGGNALDGWAWESAAMWTKGTYSSAGHAAFDRQAQEAFMGVNIDGELLYANPFGDEDPRISDYYSGPNATSSSYESESVDFSASGTILDLQTGPVGLAFGGEWRNDNIVDIRSTDNETGNVVGGSEGFGFTGDRQVTSLYAEVSVPIFEPAEIQAAARYEDYSDFGTTTKPKIAAKYRITDWLLVRGSYSGSFKAPDLALLYSRAQVSFTGSAVLDPKRPNDTPTQIKTNGRGNADLQPEETDTFSAGILVEPLNNLTLEVSYFKFDQDNLITRDGAQFTLNNEDNLPAGRVVRDELTADDIAAGETVGRLNSVNTDWFNADNFLYEGFDISIRYLYETEQYGNFRFGIDATRIVTAERISSDSQGNTFMSDYLGNQDGFYAKWTSTVSVAWTMGDWAASVYATYQDKLVDTFWPDLDAYIRVNASVSYSGLYGTTITVGARNLLDEDPPLSFSTSGDGYESGFHNPEPFFGYVRLSKEF